MSGSPTEDAEPVELTDERVGTVLAERYRLYALLGEGGMGRVYEAEHVLMKKRLAVKVLHRELTTVAEVVARFENEAMAAANIEHANIAAATDFGKLPDGSVFLVLEFVEGKNLRDEIAAGPMPVERVLHIGRQVASALASAHALEIVHRDLKPENVMLIERGGDPDFVKVLDFGIAKVPIGEIDPSSGRASNPITKVGMVFGTPEYMAPEQALGQSVDGRADLYALGTIMYEMLAGVRPFSSSSSVGILGQQLSKPVPAFAERVAGLNIPPQVELLVRRLLEREADARYQTARELAEALAALTGPAGPPRPGQQKFTLASGSPVAYAGSPPSIDSDPSPPTLEAQAPSPTPPERDPSIADLVAPGLPKPSLPTQRFEGSPLKANSPAALAPSPPEVSNDPDGPLPAFPMDSDEDLAPPTLMQGAAPPKPPRVDPLAKVSAFIDAHRSMLPRKVERLLEPVSAPLLLLGSLVLVAGGVVLVVVLVLVLSGPGDEARADPTVVQLPGVSEADRSPEDELVAAKKQGVEALEKLAEKHPKDTSVLVELMNQYLHEEMPLKAAKTAEKVLALDPNLADNEQIANALWATAQEPASMQSALGLLAGPMGKKGADKLYDLATGDNVSKAAQVRAGQLLRTKPVQENASRELSVALDLRLATTCRQRYDLLVRARNAGDRRTLELLKKYEKKSPATACMHEDDRLERAIKAIEERTSEE